jgi:hypothetical protein
MISYVTELALFTTRLYDAVLRMVVYLLACPIEKDAEDYRKESKVGVYICRFFYYVLVFIASVIPFEAGRTCMAYVRSGTQPPAYIVVLYSLLSFFSISYLYKGLPYLISRGEPYGKKKK